MEKALISGNSKRTDRPEVAWVRGQCPCCNGPVVSNAYWVSRPGGIGAYILYWECWNSLGPEEERTCEYRRVL